MSGVVEFAGSKEQLARSVRRRRAAGAKPRPFGSRPIRVVLFPNLTATLTADGQGLAGKIVTFVAGGETVCSSVTDGQGVGRCSDLVAAVKATAALEVVVRFAGDADYAPAAGRGALTDVVDVAPILPSRRL